GRRMLDYPRVAIGAPLALAMAPRGVVEVAAESMRNRRISVARNGSDLSLAAGAAQVIVKRLAGPITGESAASPERLRAGPHRLSRAHVTSIQRERIVTAAVLAVDEVGYSRTSVAQVIARARV